MSENTDTEADDDLLTEEERDPERSVMGELVLDCGNPHCCMPGYHYRSECYTAEDAETSELSDNSMDGGEQDDDLDRCACPYCFCLNRTLPGAVCGSCSSGAHQG